MFHDKFAPVVFSLVNLTWYYFHIILVKLLKPQFVVEIKLLSLFFLSFFFFLRFEHPFILTSYYFLLIKNIFIL